jgi:3-phenylpropionate/cinnamic acid dioxygenase small subunit
VEVAELIAREEIRQVLARYARAVDRADRDQVRSCFHPDAHDDHGVVEGTVDDLMRGYEVLLHGFDSTMHFLGNEYIDVHGETADVETYCIAFHRQQATPERSTRDLVLGIRYVDRFERRDGDWRIADRQVVFDWTRVDEIPNEWKYPTPVRGTRGPEDPGLERVT